MDKLCHNALQWHLGKLNLDTDGSQSLKLYPVTEVVFMFRLEHFSSN